MENQLVVYFQVLIALINHFFIFFCNITCSTYSRNLHYQISYINIFVKTSPAHCLVNGIQLIDFEKSETEVPISRFLSNLNWFFFLMSKHQCRLFNLFLYTFSSPYAGVHGKLIWSSDFVSWIMVLLFSFYLLYYKHYYYHHEVYCHNLPWVYQRFTIGLP